MTLELIAGLADKNRRYQNGIKLARHLGCLFMLVLIKDTEINTLLPAPGFPQTLPLNDQWEDFLKESIKFTFYQGVLPYQHHDRLLQVTGLATGDDCVVLLFGGGPTKAQIKPILDVIPLLTALFLQEQKTIMAQTTAMFAEKNAVKAEALAKTIDKMRLRLKDALVMQEKDKLAIEELLKKKDEFMNIASHELKTPLTSIKGYLQLLAKNNLDKEKMEVFLKKANIQADKVTGLITDLLDVSRIQGGRMALNISEFNFSEMIDTVVEEVQLTHEGFAIEVFTNPDAVVAGDRIRLEQVVTNLLINAIKYSPGSGRVLVNVIKVDHAVKVEITDFGIGIEPEKIPHVFDRFFRSDDVISKFSGLGLGLYISKEIILRHKGDIGVMSTPKQGSTFWFTLPLAG